MRVAQPSTTLIPTMGKTDEKMVNQKIGLLKERLKSVFENVNDCMVYLDLTGKILDLNRKSLELTGGSKKDFIGKHFVEFWTTDSKDKSHAMDILNKMLAGEKLIFKTFFKNKKQNIEIEVSASYIKFNGKAVGILAIARDITERNKKEEELRDIVEKYRNLTESINETFFAMDKDLRYTYWNKASERLTGILAKDAIGKTFNEVFPETVGTKVEQLYLEVLKTKQPQRLINEINIGDRNFVFEINAYPIKDGLSVIAKDMTERKYIEEKIEYQQNLFDALMDNMPDAIYFKDTESRFLRVSKVSCPGLGIKSPEEAVGMTDFDFAPKELAEQFYADDQMVMKTGKPVIGKEEMMISKVGKTWYSATKVPIKNKDGKVIGLVGISRDITKIKETEEELRHYSTQLEEIVDERTKKLQEAQRLAAIGETAAMVGHDLRNPLQTIAAIPYLVEQMIQLMPNQVKEPLNKSSLPVLMELLRDQTVYMNKIVSDLQDYARPVKLELKETNLYGMISEVLSTIQISENIEVLIEIAHDFFMALDPYLLKRVFTNLINNAVQAMPKGGKLTIKAYINGEEIALIVQDTGVGLSEENISKIFQPLFTTKARGQGLGLAVCKRIVEAHGGRITVTSKVGYGSTFTIHIPFKKELK